MNQGTSNKWVLEISDGFSGSPFAYMSGPDDFTSFFITGYQESGLVKEHLRTVRKKCLEDEGSL